MNENGFSSSDLLALMNNNGGMGNMWNNPFMYLIWLAMFGNGFGGFGFGNNAAAAQGSLTRAELVDGFNNQTIQNDVRGIQSSLSEGFAGIAQNLCSGFANTNANANQNANMISQAINTNTFQNQLNTTGINNSINNLKYEMAQNCCELKTAMHAEGEETRDLIQSTVVQDLRDKLADKSSELQAAQITLANTAQTQNILNSLGKYVPGGCSPCSPCSPCGW